MFYTSDDLMSLRSEMAAHNVTVDRLSVRYNPWDLGEVWVLNPVDSRYIKATAVDQVMKGMTAYQWRVLKRAIRERFDGPEHLQNLSAGRNAIREVVEEAVRSHPAVGGYERPAIPTAPLHDEQPCGDSRSCVGRFSACCRPFFQCQEPAIDTDQVDDRPSANPLPIIDPSEIDVSDWEVASPEL